ncbi:MAG: galactose ABC transporter substrate-binding protein [Blautia sp.]|nr:galactose ABC transporter substrate-binding protein [Blautia sp.]
MKRTGNAAILLLCAVLFMAGCSGEFRKEKRGMPRNLKIGICAYDQYDTFILSVIQDFQTAAKQKEKETGISITVEVAGAGGKQNVQNDQVADFIDSGCDILCVNIVDRTDATMIIDKAKNADVPVIFFNRELVQEDLRRWDKLYYVGSEPQKSGIMQGEIITRLCGGENGITVYDRNRDGKLQYVMLEGEAGHQDALIRTEYCVKTITDAGILLEKLGDEIANWNRAQAQTKMNLWINEFGDEIELVLCNNDDMALGAIDAWKESGRSVFPVIVGIDGNDAALEAVKEGTMAGTVINDAKGQAESMLALACALGCHTELPQELQDGTYIRLHHRIVTSENVDEMINH